MEGHGMKVAGVALVVALAGASVAAGAVAVGKPVESAGIHWLGLWMGLFGGLALFLAGMELMSDSLKQVAGSRLKMFLGKMTSNRFTGAFSGAFITAILNSSSVTTVLVVGFISAGLMSLQQSLGVIMGANIGTTITAQVVAFNVTQFALVPVALGFLMRFVGKRERVRYHGGVVMGLGLVFYGMGLMGEAMAPLRTYAPFLEAMERMGDPVLGVLAGALFTAVIQSSSAMTGIAIAMAGGGLITLEAGVALALGANIGTCVTAVLAAMGKPRAAMQTAMAHVLFNVFGVAIWVFMIPQLCGWVRLLSPAHPELEGAARMAAEVPRQIANAHTLFNVANTVLFIGLTRPFARLVMWLVPDRVKESEQIIEPRYLDEELLQTPALALENVRRELGHLGDVTAEMFTQMADAEWRVKEGAMEQLVRMDDKVDILSEKILRYLASLPREEMGSAEGRELLDLMTATDVMEGVGDVFENEIVETMRRVSAYEVRASEAMEALMRNLYLTVNSAFKMAVQAVVERDETAAQAVLELKAKVNGEVERAIVHQAEHLTMETKNRLKVFRVEMEFVNSLKRIYSLSKRLAKLALPREVHD